MKVKPVPFKWRLKVLSALDSNPEGLRGDLESTITEIPGKRTILAVCQLANPCFCSFFNTGEEKIKKQMPYYIGIFLSHIA